MRGLRWIPLDDQHAHRCTHIEGHYTKYTLTQSPPTTTFLPPWYRLRYYPGAGVTTRWQIVTCRDYAVFAPTSIRGERWRVFYVNVEARWANKHLDMAAEDSRSFRSRPRMEFRAPMLCSRWNIVRYPIIKIITLPLCNSIRSAYLEMNLVCFFFYYYYWTNRGGWKLWEASLVKFWFGILFFFFFFRWRVIQINFSCCLSKWGEEKLLRKLGRKFWLTLEKCERSRSVYQRSSH